MHFGPVYKQYYDEEAAANALKKTTILDDEHSEVTRWRINFGYLHLYTFTVYLFKCKKKRNWFLGKKVMGKKVRKVPTFQKMKNFCTFSEKINPNFRPLILKEQTFSI